MRIFNVINLSLSIAFAAALAPVCALAQAAPLSHADCAQIVEALLSQRFEREEGPIAEYHRAVQLELASRLKGGARSADDRCPAGFRPGDSNGAVACFAERSAFDRYPNVAFHPLQSPRLERRRNGRKAACVEVSWLIFSLGEQRRTICSDDRIEIPKREAFMAEAVAEACGDAPGEDLVCPK